MISLLELVEFLEDVLSKFSARNHLENQHLLLTLSPTLKKKAELLPISMQSMLLIHAYATKIGVNVDDFMISQPDYGEEALNIAEMLARSNAVDVIVIDSVAALVPKAELRRRNWRSIHGTAGANDVSGASKADGDSCQEQHLRNLHQPDPRKDRSGVRQSRDNNWRKSSKVLLLGQN